MQNLLISASGAERLKSQLNQHAGKINLYLMHEGGKITLDGNEVDTADADIHLGWFSRDVVAEGYAREYAVQLLKAANLKWVQSLSAGLDDPFFQKAC